MAEDLSDTIAAAAAAPAKVTSDGESVEAHSLPDQIAADRYLREQTVAAGGKFPLRMFKISPGGA